ncbi:unnamed protein product [Larinioides sclopetarius]|uniref:Uncharacterized protein n=1 Tax=Larinioides sclopetarius TaxID=280406 RepID=A0AAV1ZCR5_9ARAC
MSHQRKSICIQPYFWTMVALWQDLLSSCLEDSRPDSTEDLLCISSYCALNYMQEVKHSLSIMELKLEGRWSAPASSSSYGHGSE